jgi:hypothetical protein
MSPPRSPWPVRDCGGFVTYLCGPPVTVAGAREAVAATPPRGRRPACSRGDTQGCDQPQEGSATGWAASQPGPGEPPPRPRWPSAPRQARDLTRSSLLLLFRLAPVDATRLQAVVFRAEQPPSQRENPVTGLAGRGYARWNKARQGSPSRLTTSGWTGKLAGLPRIRPRGLGWCASAP